MSKQPLQKKTYVIIEGGVKMEDGFLQPGDTIELDDVEAKKMDPQGTAFMLKKEWEAKKAAEEAAKKAAAEALKKAEAEEKRKAAEEAKKAAEEAAKKGGQ